MSSARHVLQFLVDALADGKGAALVTITSVIGSSSRAVGTHLAVREDGTWQGSLSGGCVEAAVVGEALRVLASGQSEILRLGAGSPLIDIRLPCGGGLDLLIMPIAAEDGPSLTQACALLADRQPVALTMSVDAPLSVELAPPTLSTGWNGPIFVARHDPDLRLVLIGHGEEVSAMAELGRSYGAEIVVLTPERALAEQMAAEGAVAHILKTPARSAHLVSDRYTAVIFLFHDHDWEIDLICQATEQDAFFLGAMGSPRTQARRVDALRAAGLPEQAIGRIRGPIGLIPSTRDPRTLALSVLAQIVDEFRQSCCTQPLSDSRTYKLAG